MYDIAVIGTVFNDIKGFSAVPYDPFGRNQGRVEVCPGGVGRNVAENLANLGLSVRFISSADDDLLGNGVLSHLSSLGADVRYVNKTEKGGMGIWMLINNREGEQAGSLSQLPDPCFTEEILNTYGEKLFEDVNSIALETDFGLSITQKTLKLAKKLKKKVYALPATMQVVFAQPELLRETECFICNHIEAGKLFGRSSEDPKEMLDILKKGADDLGLTSMVVTMGSRGAVYCHRKQDLFGHVPAPSVDVLDSSGAGDSFFSGTVAACLRGKPLDQAVQIGTKLAALTIQVTRCTCDTQTVKDANLL